MELKKQVTLNAFSAFANMFIQWLISVALVRLGGFADAGVFSLAMSVSAVFNAVANYNIRGYQISDANGQFAQKQYLWARVGTIAASFVLCGAYFAVDAVYDPASRAATWVYLLYVDCNMFSDVLFGTLQLKNKLYVNAYSNLLKGVLCAASFLGSYALRGDLLFSLLCMTAANALAMLLYDLPHYFGEEKHAFRLRRADLPAIARILVLCFPLMISSMLPMITTALPRRTITLYYGEAALGIFSSLFTPTVVITTLMPAVIQGLVPVIAAHWQNREKRAFAALTAKCFAGILAFTLFAMLCALIAGRPVMRLLFGEEILPYFGLLYLAIFVSGLCAMRSCGNGVLVCMRKTCTVTVSAALELLVAVAFSGVLIRHNGIFGAALALLAAYGGNLLFQLAAIAWFSKRQFVQAGSEGSK